MTRIDFYILAEPSQGNRHTLACRLADKAYQQGHRVYLHADSEQEAAQLDRLLWTFRDRSFVPHGLSGQVDTARTPVLIGWGDEAADEHDVLINLGREVPHFFSRFERVMEPVDQAEEIRTAARQRFRFYRDRGYPLDTHDIKQ